MEYKERHSLKFAEKPNVRLVIEVNGKVVTTIENMVALVGFVTAERDGISGNGMLILGPDPEVGALYAVREKVLKETREENPKYDQLFRAAEEGVSALKRAMKDKDKEALATALGKIVNDAVDKEIRKKSKK